MKHYSKEELDRYIQKDVNFLIRRKMKSHIEACPSCAKKLNELAEDNRLLDEIRKSVHDNALESDKGAETYSKLSAILGEKRHHSSVA